MYAWALRAGILPDLFWRSTVAEVVLMIRGREDLDRKAWERHSHLLSMMYNINRGKNAALTADDFNPYDREQRYIAPTKITPQLINELTAMQSQMNSNGTR